MRSVSQFRAVNFVLRGDTRCVARAPIVARVHALVPYRKVSASVAPTSSAVAKNDFVTEGFGIGNLVVGEHLPPIMLATLALHPEGDPPLFVLGQMRAPEMLYLLGRESSARILGTGLVLTVAKHQFYDVGHAWGIARSGGDTLCSLKGVPARPTTPG